MVNPPTPLMADWMTKILPELRALMEELAAILMLVPVSVAVVEPVLVATPDWDNVPPLRVRLLMVMRPSVLKPKAPPESMDRECFSSSKMVSNPVLSVFIFMILVY
jgi:hypothetical protein